MKGPVYIYIIIFSIDLVLTDKIELEIKSQFPFLKDQRDTYYLKRDVRIEKHLAWRFVCYSECLSNPSSLLCNSNKYNFINSRISNHEKGFRFQPIRNPL